MDWNRWHKDYDDPGSSLSRRLETVRTLIRGALDEAPAGELRAVSACAGQGRDLIPVLAGHSRGRDVRARLVELDPELADRARRDAAAAGLAGVDVVTGDAALTDQYLDLAPANLVLMCGVYGNITTEDIEATVAACAGLCARGGTVIWTRGRMKPPGDWSPGSANGTRSAASSGCGSALRTQDSASARTGSPSTRRRFPVDTGCSSSSATTCSGHPAVTVVAGSSREEKAAPGLDRGGAAGRSGT